MPKRDRPVAYEMVADGHGDHLLVRGHGLATGERVRVVPERTPLHELVELCREQGLALDFAVYGPDDPICGDDTKSTYVGGARVTGHKGDPMDVIRAAVRAQRAAAEEAPNA